MFDEAKMRELFNVNPFNHDMGGELIDISLGHTRGRVKMEKRHQNIYEGMHGGALYWLADALAGVAVATYGHYVTTLNGNINYLRPAKNTEYVWCEADVVRAGRTIGVIDYKIYGDDDTLFATGTFNYYILEQEM